MLATQVYTLDEALDELDERIDSLEDERARVDPSTDQHEAVQSRIDRLAYFQNGLRWQRDETDWGGDAEIELGAIAAKEKAMMHRKAPSNAEESEMEMWFVAASTVDAPYAGDSLTDTFHGIGDCHPGFVEWAQAKANSLGVPGGPDAGNRSATSSTAPETSGTSTETPNSPTSSSSGSPTE